MENTEGQKPNARGEKTTTTKQVNKRKQKRAVVESLSCPPGGLQLAIQRRKNRKNSALNKPGWTSFIIRVTTQGKKKETETQSRTVRGSARIWRHVWPRQVLPTSRPGTLLPCPLSSSCFRQPRSPHDCSPPLSMPFGTTHSGCVALSAHIRFILVPPNHEPNHEPLVCVEDPPVPLPRLLICNGPHRDLNSKHQRAVFRGPLFGSKHSEVFN